MQLIFNKWFHSDENFGYVGKVNFKLLKPSLSPSPQKSTYRLLRVEDLRVSFEQDQKKVVAVDGVSFEMEEGASLGIIGESGSGKTVTGLSVMGLLQSPPAHIEGGSIEFQGRPLVRLGKREHRKLLGKKMAMIFQEPLSALNPVFTVGAQIVEMIRQHESLTKKDAEKKVVALLAEVGIEKPETRFFNYPHEFSGGMRQRVMIAMAMACKPDLLIADEPTTALDATVRKQVMDLIKHVQYEIRSALILISHDVGMVKQYVDEIAVMYAGKVVEHIPKERFEMKPHHPYTEGMFACSPSLLSSGFSGSAVLRTKLPTIEGQVPSLANLPAGCRFQNRCAYKKERCTLEEPPIMFSDNEQATSHKGVACWYPLT